MSAIVGYRERVMHAVRQGVPALKHVDWNDGLFDENEVRDWSIPSPSAFVSIHGVNADHHTTGEITAELRMRIVVVAHNKRRPRDADVVCWQTVEQIAVIVNHNRFCDKPDGGKDGSAGAATGLRIDRIPDPQLLNEGVALGLIEWQANLTFGINHTYLREFVFHDGAEVQPVPPDVFASSSVNAGGLSGGEELQVVYAEDGEP